MESIRFDVYRAIRSVYVRYDGRVWSEVKKSKPVILPPHF